MRTLRLAATRGAPASRPARPSAVSPRRPARRAARLCLALGGSFAHAIGFPRPIAAELEGTGVGSVRHASFEGGVVFREVVTAWVPLRALAFTIDPGAVPPETFDQHVAVGGPYFDVLDGRYVTEPLAPGPDGAARVRLASTHRRSTTVNGYTRLWTDLFMRDIQQAILDVIRDRAERAARPPQAGR